MAKNQTPNKATNEYEAESPDKLNILQFPEGSSSSEKKRMNIHTSNMSKGGLRLSEPGHEEDSGKKEAPSQKGGLDPSLEGLEEKEKKLRYHIRELESFFGLS